MKTFQGFPLTMLILEGQSIDGQPWKIHKDFAKITSDNVDPGGVN